MVPIIAYYSDVKKGDKIPIYGAKKVKIGCSLGHVKLENVIYIDNTFFETMGSIEFPIINGKSPKYLTVTYVSAEKVALNVLIEEFGGIPSETYFKDGA